MKEESNWNSHTPSEPVEKKYEVWVELTYVGHKHPYQGTYNVVAKNEEKAKDKAAALLRESIVKNHGSLWGDICTWDKYKVKELK